MSHNYYQQPGGEDQVFAAEASLLERHGHTVVRMVRHNDQVRGMSSLRVAQAALWNTETWRDVRNTIRTERIDLAHFHNTFPLISPAAYYAAKSLNVPVVQSLHNYRLVCPGSLLFRDGKVCEKCLTASIPLAGVAHACYRGSRAQTGVVAGMLTMHRAIGTWSQAVDGYIALTEFARNKFVQGGLPEGKISVKPNFLSSDPGPGRGNGKFALFVGRVTADKGVLTLLDAWRKHATGLPLKIAGDGPLLSDVTDQAKSIAGVHILGPKTHAEVLELMKAASVLIFPSLWYEGLPMTIVEAFATALPVIASNLGSLSSLVQDGVTGAHFEPGNAASLAGVVKQLVARPEALERMRVNARTAYERHHSPDGNYAALMNIYEKAARTASGSPATSPAKYRMAN